jgi:hypothetical protein
MAILTVEFALAQLLHTFDWRVEGDPSELDMKEACATTMPRQAPLFAYPNILLLKIAKLIVVNRVFESLEKLVGLVSRVSIAGHY